MIKRPEPISGQGAACVNTLLILMNVVDTVNFGDIASNHSATEATPCFTFLRLIVQHLE